MKKFFVIALALALTAGAAYANYCARDFVPAATLLVPYAVVDMNGNTPNPNGYTTILSVTNVSYERQLIHVTVWSPLSRPVVDFDEVLSGYDVWTINFRDVLTGHFDYFDTEGVTGFWPSPHYGPNVNPFGPSTNYPFSDTLYGPDDTDYPSDLDSSDGCYFPYDYHPEYGAGIVRALQIDTFPIDFELTCSEDVVTVDWLENLTDDPLFFYVTIDASKECNQFFPWDDDYFEAFEFIDDDNVLLGELYYLDAANNRSEAMAAVHIEFDWDVLYDCGFYTFYELHNFDFDCDSDGPSYFDGLEPLATAFAFRYYNSGGISSELMVWKNHYDVLYFYSIEDYWFASCGPYIYYAWDENEKSKTRQGGPSGFDQPEPDVIPWETQAVPLDQTNWTGLMPNNGWMLLVFDPAIFGLYEEGFYWPTEAWVGVRHYWGTYSAGLEAATMANTWCFPVQALEYLPYWYLSVNYDYDMGEPPYWF